MLIGLCGLKSSGKDTAADYLVDVRHFVKLSYASGVKNATAQIFNWDRNMLEGDTKLSRKFRETKDEFWSNEFGYDVYPREMLQLMGTKGGRKTFHQNIWVSRVKNIILQNPDTNYVITDNRFPNEVDMVKELGGYNIKLERNLPEWYNEDVIKSIRDKETANKNNFLEADEEYMHISGERIHASEYSVALCDVDYKIINNGENTIDELDISIEKVYKRILGE